VLSEEPGVLETEDPEPEFVASPELAVLEGIELHLAKELSVG
jgi:hypothetical protein